MAFFSMKKKNGLKYIKFNLQGTYLLWALAACIIQHLGGQEDLCFKAFIAAYERGLRITSSHSPLSLNIKTLVFSKEGKEGRKRVRKRREEVGEARDRWND